MLDSSLLVSVFLTPKLNETIGQNKHLWHDVTTTVSIVIMPDIYQALSDRHDKLVGTLRMMLQHKCQIRHVAHAELPAHYGLPLGSHLYV